MENDWERKKRNIIVIHIDKPLLLETIKRYDATLTGKVKNLTNEDMEEIAMRIEEHILKTNMIEDFTKEYIEDLERAWKAGKGEEKRNNRK